MRQVGKSRRTLSALAFCGPRKSKRAIINGTCTVALTIRGQGAAAHDACQVDPIHRESMAMFQAF
jgi:hypothetical protein